MARVFKQDGAHRITLPGRAILEIVARQGGAEAVTLRRVEIPPAREDEARRGPHIHRDFEECIYVLSGEGAMHADSGIHQLQAGDTILVPAGERHVTYNAGITVLVLLCFFPVNDIRPGTEEASFSASN